MTDGVAVVDLAVGRQCGYIATPTLHKESVMLIAPDGKSTVAIERIADRDQVVSAYEIETGKRLWTIRAMGPKPLPAFNSAGDRAAICFDHDVQLVDAKTGRADLTLSHPRGVTASQFCDDDSLVLTACSDGAIRVWDARSGEMMEQRQAHLESATHLAISPDERLLATFGEDRKLKVWRRADGANVATFSLPDLLASLHFIDEGATVMCVTWYTISFWDVSEQVMILQLPSFWGNNRHLWLTPDRKSLLLRDEDRLRLINVLP
jgi:WD40 repeat protein